jgi:hypothetical protein
MEKAFKEFQKADSKDLEKALKEFKNTDPKEFD